MNTLSASNAAGRAFRARPLVCLLSIAALVLGLLASPAAATTILKTPTLTGTLPASPSTALRPTVTGNSEGVITSVFGAGSKLGAVTRAGGEHSDLQITIYAEDPTCSQASAIVAEGSASQLDSSGIQVESDVKADWTTHFYADQSDPEGHSETSECSAGLPYRQVSTPPAAPSFTSINPISPSGVDTPRLIGTVTAQATITIYADPSCLGAPLASGSAAEFEAAGIAVSLADGSTTTFYATASLAGLVSSCSSSSIAYQDVAEGAHEQPHEQPGGGEGPHESLPNPPGAPAPPKLRTNPEGTANDNTPKVTGRAPGATSVEIFDGVGCRGVAIASGSVAQFSAGLTIHVADNASVNLYGVAIDGGGDRSACSSDPVTYTDDATMPYAEFTSGPGAKTRKHTVLFTFIDSSGDPSASFLCRLDRRPWSKCQSPLRLSKLGHRRHRLTVRGVDAAGNVEESGTTRSFKVVRGH